MSTFDLLALLVVMIPLAAMPSSSVALVVARTLGSGRTNGIFSAMGIVTGDLVFVSMALIGMSVLAEQLGNLFIFVKYICGAYLIWLGVSLVRSGPHMNIAGNQSAAATLAADFLAGLILTLGDIKAIFFYATLFPAVVDMNQIGIRETTGIFAVTFLSVGGVKLIYVMFASEIAARVRGKRSLNLINRMGGALLVGCGTALIIQA